MSKLCRQMLFRASLISCSGFAEVKLPAEEVDRYQRPGFITLNDAGIEVCENRLSCTIPFAIPLIPTSADLSPPSRSRRQGSRPSQGPASPFTVLQVLEGYVPASPL